MIDHIYIVNVMKSKEWLELCRAGVCCMIVTEYTMGNPKSSQVPVSPSNGLPSFRESLGIILLNHPA